MISVRLIGMEGTLKQIHTLQEGAQAHGDVRLVFGATLVYAFGQETGHHKGGRLARKDGGAWFIRDGYRQVAPSIPGRLASAVPRGEAAVKRIYKGIGDDLVGAGRARVPVRSGDLSRDIRSAFRSR